jgi:RNA polymerase sigma-70 factor (ECF subfamily)
MAFSKSKALLFPIFEKAMKAGAPACTLPSISFHHPVLPVPVQPQPWICVYLSRTIHAGCLPESQLLALRTGAQENTLQDVEAQWLARAHTGDADAFSQLVEVYQTAVYNLCYRMLGDPYEAEDAAQETFLRAYRSMARYDRNRPFSTWLLSIAAHYCIDQIRKRRVMLLPIEELPYQEIQDPGPNPESVASRNEEQQRVQALLESLNPVDRASIVMYYWYDFSYDEIAQALGLTTSAVKSRLHRSRRELALAWPEHSNQEKSPERKHHESPAF